MRTSLFILSALVVVAACANDAETTAPRIASTTSTGGYNSKLDFPPGPGATASSPVTGAAAKSKVITVTSQPAQVDGFITKVAVADVECPPGTELISGGFRVLGGYNLKVVESYPRFYFENAWRVTGYLEGESASFQAIAKCMQ